MSTSLEVFVETEVHNKWVNINNRNCFDGFDLHQTDCVDSIQPTYFADLTPEDVKASLGKSLELHQDSNSLADVTKQIYQKWSQEVTGTDNGLVCFSMNLIDLYKQYLAQPLDLLLDILCHQLYYQNRMQLWAYSWEYDGFMLDVKDEIAKHSQRLRLADTRIICIFDCSQLNTRI